MHAKKGYYSLIQFCPDASRLEGVNLGVVLFCPDATYIAARIAQGNQRAAKLVGRDALDRAALNAAKRAMERRFTVDAGAFRSLEDFQRFIDTRANVLRLTPPRTIKVFEPAEDLSRLFAELVGGRPRRKEPVAKIPQLDELFHRLHAEGRAQLNVEIPIPILGRAMRSPYAFDNDVLNLVRPQRFSSDEDQAAKLAERLAIEGNLLHTKANTKLILVPKFEASCKDPDLAKRLCELFEEYDVEIVRPDGIDAFAKHVDQVAHS